MPYFALRVVCSNCGGSFLFGGGAEGDIARWRGMSVKCRSCGLETQLADSEAERLAPEPAHALRRRGPRVQFSGRGAKRARRSRIETGSCATAACRPVRG